MPAGSVALFRICDTIGVNVKEIGMHLISQQNLVSFLDEMIEKYGDEFKRAAELVIHHRRGQSRKIKLNGIKTTVENYLHEFWVCNLVEKYCEQLCITGILKRDLIIAAVLHDLYEDFMDDLDGFDEKIKSIVFDVSKNHPTYGGFSKMGIAGVVLKTADRSVNLFTCIGIFSNKKISQYIEETKEMIHSFDGTDAIRLFCHNELIFNLALLEERINESNTCDK